METNSSVKGGSRVWNGRERLDGESERGKEKRKMVSKEQASGY
jgi:hypothetical protein